MFQPKGYYKEFQTLTKNGRPREKWMQAGGDMKTNLRAKKSWLKAATRGSNARSVCCMRGFLLLVYFKMFLQKSSKCLNMNCRQTRLGTNLTSNLNPRPLAKPCTKPGKRRIVEAPDGKHAPALPARRDRHCQYWMPLCVHTINTGAAVSGLINCIILFIYKQWPNRMWSTQFFFQPDIHVARCNDERLVCNQFKHFLRRLPCTHWQCNEYCWNEEGGNVWCKYQDFWLSG